MAYPTTRSANEELHRGADDGCLQMTGKDWSYNHPDIQVAEPVDCVDPHC